MHSNPDPPTSFPSAIDVDFLFDDKPDRTEPTAYPSFEYGALSETTYKATPELAALASCLFFLASIVKLPRLSFEALEEARESLEDIADHYRELARLPAPTEGPEAVPAMFGGIAETEPLEFDLE